MVTYKTPLPAEVCGVLTRGVGGLCEVVPQEHRGPWHCALTKLAFGLARNYQAEELNRFQRAQMYRPSSTQERVTVGVAEGIMGAVSHHFELLKADPQGPTRLLELCEKQSLARTAELHQLRANPAAMPAALNLPALSM